MHYKIDIHAHSIFSDGANSPYVMAMKAKELGFTSLVLTDHFYGRKVPAFINENSMRVLKKACREASSILPVIIGIEVPFMGQEVLVFGGAAIKDILTNGRPTMDRMIKLKEETGCAVILCHPNVDFNIASHAVDGYERINNGVDFFRKGDEVRSLEDLSGKPSWSNSDAHRSEDLGTVYNIVDSKIETESDLIGYIKKGKQPLHWVESNLG